MCLYYTGDCKGNDSEEDAGNQSASVLLYNTNGQLGEFFVSLIMKVNYCGSVIHSSIP